MIEETARTADMLIDITTEFDAWSKVPGLDNLIKVAALAAVGEYREDFKNQAELSVLLTSQEAIHILNQRYRGRNEPTNVISFPGEVITRSECRSFLLGDIVLSYQTIENEAEQQRISFENHVSHLIVHGVLHLLGHDHENEETAQDMELLEINILKGIGVENPYA